MNKNNCNVMHLLMMEPLEAVITCESHDLHKEFVNTIS